MIDDVPMSPYPDNAPYPFRTRVWARHVSWYVTISDRDMPPSEPVMVSNMEPCPATRGRA